MGLFRKKKKLDTDTLGQPLDKLIDGELPFGWYSHNQDYLKPYEDELTRLASAIYSSTDKKQSLLNYFEYLEKFKQDCKSKDECFEYYFAWMYENNKNSGIAEKQKMLDELM